MASLGDFTAGFDEDPIVEAPMEEITIDESLTLIERMFRYAQSDLVLHRLFVAKDVAETVNELSVDEVLTKVEPIINVLRYDNEVLVRQALAEQLAALARYFVQNGGDPDRSLVVNHVMPHICGALLDSEDAVRTPAQDSLYETLALGGFSDAQLEAFLCPVVLKLSTDENEDDRRTEALSIMARLAPILSPEIVRQHFVAQACTLAADSMFRVRKACALSIGKICLAVGSETSVERLLPCFRRLASDEIWGVRRACAESLADVAASVDSDVRWTACVELFQAFCGDHSRWVRSAAYQCLGPLIAAFGPNKTEETREKEEQEEKKKEEKQREAQEEKESRVVQAETIEESSEQSETETSDSLAVVAEASLDNDDGTASNTDDTVLSSSPSSLVEDQPSSEAEPSYRGLRIPSRSSSSSDSAPTTPNDITYPVFADTATTTTSITIKETPSALVAGSETSFTTAPSASTEVISDPVTTDDLHFASCNYWTNPIPMVDVNLDDFRSGKPIDEPSVSSPIHSNISLVNDSFDSLDLGDNFLAVDRKDDPTRGTLFLHAPRSPLASSNDVNTKNNSDLTETLFGDPNLVTHLTIPQILLDEFIRMGTPDTARSNDADPTFQCAFNFPAVVLTLGKDHWHLLRETFFSLSLDLEWRVRRTLAHSVHEIARVIGPELTQKDLQEVFDRFLYDLDDVRVGAVRHLADFIAILPVSARERYLKPLNELRRTENVRNWRFRSLFCTQLQRMCSLFPPDLVHKYIGPIAIDMSCDEVDAVRSAAHLTIAAVYETVSASAPLRDEFINNICVSFSESPYYLHRISFVRVIEALLPQMSHSPEIFVEVFLLPLLALVHDPVPNVRITVAKALVTSILVHDVLRHILRDNADVQAAMCVLMEDSDRDVALCVGVSPSEVAQRQAQSSELARRLEAHNFAPSSDV